MRHVMVHRYDNKAYRDQNRIHFANGFIIGVYFYGSARVFGRRSENHAKDAFPK